MNTNNTLTMEKNLMKYKTVMVQMPHKHHSSSLVDTALLGENLVHTPTTVIHSHPDSRFSFRDCKLKK